MTLKSGQRSVKVIGTDTHQSATCDFLLMFHGNYGPLLYRFWVRWRFQSKIPTPVYFVPRWRVVLGNGYRCRASKNYNDGATRRSRCFKMGLAIWTQYRHVMDRQTDSHLSTSKTRHVARVKMINFWQLMGMNTVCCSFFDLHYNCIYTVEWQVTRGTSIRGLMRGMATLPKVTRSY